MYSLSCKMLLNTLYFINSMPKVKEQTSSKKSRYHYSTENSQRSFHKSVKQEETYFFQQPSKNSSLKQISNEKSNAVS